MNGYSSNANGLQAMMAANGLVSSIISTAAIICIVVGMWKMFRKADKPGWAALVPFYQTWVWGSVVFANKKKTIVWLASEIIMAVLLGILFALALTASPAPSSSMYPPQAMTYSSPSPIQLSGAVMGAGLLFTVSLLVYSVLQLMAFIATAWSFNKRDGFAVGLMLLEPIFLLIIGLSRDAVYVGPGGAHDREYADYDNQPVEGELPYPVQPDAGFQAGQPSSSQFAGEPPTVPLPAPVPVGMKSAPQPMGVPEMPGAAPQPMGAPEMPGAAPQPAMSEPLGAAPQPAAIPGMPGAAPQPVSVAEAFGAAPQPMGAPEMPGAAPQPVVMPEALGTASQPGVASMMPGTAPQPGVTFGMPGAAPQLGVASGMMEFASQPGAVSQGLESAAQPQVQTFSQIGDPQGLPAGMAQQSPGQMSYQAPQPDAQLTDMLVHGFQDASASAWQQDSQQLQPLYPVSAQAVQQNGFDKQVGQVSQLPNTQEVQQAFQPQIGQEAYEAFPAQPGWSPARELQAPVARSGWEPGQSQRTMQQVLQQQVQPGIANGFAQQQQVPSAFPVPQVQQQAQQASQVQPTAMNGTAPQQQASSVFPMPQIQQTAQMPPVQQAPQVQPPLQGQQFPQA